MLRIEAHAFKLSRQPALERLTLRIICSIVGNCLSYIRPTGAGCRRLFAHEIPESNRQMPGVVSVVAGCDLNTGMPEELGGGENAVLFGDQTTEFLAEGVNGLLIIHTMLTKPFE